MRNGDFSVEIVPRGKGPGVRETDAGHVLARPGQVYALRIRNFGPLRCVADVTIDGRNISAGGLVIEPWCTEELERPISPDEDGRFTVVAEGDERVFGPDGGRDNPDLGLIVVRFRRELPRGGERARPLPPTLLDLQDRPFTRPSGQPSRLPPDVFPTWNVLNKQSGGAPNGNTTPFPRHVGSEPLDLSLDDDSDIERAAGTGLTGHSSQRFTPIELGPLEAEATVVQLRLVIATAEAIEEARSLLDPRSPARPAARP